MKHDDRLIVALDFPTLEQAKACVLELGEAVSYYKVGMELYGFKGIEMEWWHFDYKPSTKWAHLNVNM